MSLMTIMMMITAFIVTFMVFRFAVFRLMVWLKPSNGLKLTYIDGEGVARSKTITLKSDAPTLVDTILEMRAKTQQHSKGRA